MIIQYFLHLENNNKISLSTIKHMEVNDFNNLYMQMPHKKLRQYLQMYCHPLIFPNCFCYVNCKEHNIFSIFHIPKLSILQSMTKVNTNSPDFTASLPRETKKLNVPNLGEKLPQYST